MGKGPHGQRIIAKKVIVFGDANSKSYFVDLGLTIPPNLIDSNAIFTWICVFGFENQE
jgi:hypothetical protein